MTEYVYIQGRTRACAGLLFACVSAPKKSCARPLKTPFFEKIDRFLNYVSCTLPYKKW